MAFAVTLMADIAYNSQRCSCPIFEDTDMPRDAYMAVPMKIVYIRVVYD